ncbi:MAG TPA: hypothetical protein VLC09_14280 [Polyangiaceae bacterium]|nr:hypothetical protein [Polyangiaceae bacterium]
MKRLRKFSPLAVPFALLLTAGASVGGCVENRSSVYIHQVMRPCNDVTASPDEPAISEGVYDPARGSYMVPLLVANQLTPLGDQDTLKPETSRFVVKGIEVEVLSNDLATVITAYQSVAAGTVSPSDSEDPGYGIVWATIVPGSANVRTNQRVISSVRVFGETLAGTELETGVFQFPVNVVARGSYAVGIDETGDCVDPPDTPPEDDQCLSYSCRECAGGNCFNAP